MAGLTLAAPALLAVAAVIAGILRPCSEAQRWEELWAPQWMWQGWWRWLAVLAGLALLHALWVRAQYLNRARLSRRELEQEQRETEPPVLVRRWQELFRRRR